MFYIYTQFPLLLLLLLLDSVQLNCMGIKPFLGDLKEAGTYLHCLLSFFFFFSCLHVSEFWHSPWWRLLCYSSAHWLVILAMPKVLRCILYRISFFLIIFFYFFLGRIHLFKKEIEDGSFEQDFSIQYFLQWWCQIYYQHTIQLKVYRWPMTFCTQSLDVLSSTRIHN